MAGATHYGVATLPGPERRVTAGDARPEGDSGRTCLLGNSWSHSEQFVIGHLSSTVTEQHTFPMLHTSGATPSAHLPSADRIPMESRCVNIVRSRQSWDSRPFAKGTDCQPAEARTLGLI